METRRGFKRSPLWPGRDVVSRTAGTGGFCHLGSVSRMHEICYLGGDRNKIRIAEQ